MKNLIIALIFGCTSYVTYGQQLNYKAVNPNFGGDTFNYQQLLASANSQNSFTADDGRDEQSELADFADDVNRRVLSQLQRTLLRNTLGDDLQPGNFNFGSLSLEIFESDEGLVINILDTTTGEETQVIVPN